jgi:hypothetical protein
LPDLIGQSRKVCKSLDTPRTRQGQAGQAGGMTVFRSNSYVRIRVFTSSGFLKAFLPDE